MPPPPPPSPWAFLIELGAAVVGLVALAGFFLCSAAGFDPGRIALKAVPVLALAVLASVRCTSLSRAFVIGLLFDAVGDLLLELGNPALFVFGLLAFLVGHIGFTIAFVKERSALSLLRAVPFLLLGILVMALCWTGAGGLALPLLVYAAVLMVMAWRAVARLDVGSPVRLWWGVVGAGFFVFSDSLIAVTMFVRPFTDSVPIVLVTYWIAQVLLTSSLPSRAETGGPKMWPFVP